MSASVEDLAAQAIRLPADERTRLAGLLLASLPDDMESDIDAAWDAEIRRRVDEVGAGTADLTSSDDVHAAARKIYRR